MRSMKVLVCLALVAFALACKKSDDMGGAGSGGAGGSSNAGSGSNDDGGLSTAGTTAGNAGGGGGTGGAGEQDAGPIIPIDTPPAIADLASSLAEGVCGALLDCVGEAKLNELVGGEDCEARVTSELLAGEFAYLQEAIDGDRVVLDTSKLDACVTGIRALGCKIQTDNFPADCENVVEGKVAVGDECSISSECAGTAFCPSNPCPAKCTELLAADDDCNADEECGDDLICLNGACAKPGGSGATCAGTSGKVCALGFACWDGNANQTGTCHSNDDTLAGSENAECSPGSVLCKEGLSCVYFEEGLDKGFHCESRVASGAACHQGLPGQCPGSDYCDISSTPDPPSPYVVLGTCKPRPGDGEDCVGNGVCGAHFVCVPKGDGGGVCRRIQNTGGACSIDAACRSDYCNAGKCESPAVCN